MHAPVAALLAATALWACAAVAADPVLALEAKQIVLEGLPSQDVPACSTCHGLQGQGLPERDAPRLAQLDAGYLARQLAAFASGQRRNAVMAPIARALSPPQREALAAHFAALPAPAAKAGPVDDAGLSRGRELAEAGDWSRNAPPCAACHGPHGEGVGSVTPPLVGQTQAYLEGQLRAFRSGQRTGLGGLMNGIANRLSGDDLRAAAAYYASLPLPSDAQPGGAR
jgi:cytochrome c553